MPSVAGADVLIRPPRTVPGSGLCRGAGLVLVHTRVEFPILGKKRALSSRDWDESANTLRGATQFQASVDAPFAVCCGKETAPVSGPAADAVFLRAISPNPFQPRGFSLLGGNRATHAPSRRWMDLMLPQNGEKVKSYRANGTRLGFITSRQSRSPRARPWMRSSAVATLVAMGTECWSHRREM